MILKAREKYKCQKLFEKYNSQFIDFQESKTSKNKIKLKIYLT